MQSPITRLADACKPGDIVRCHGQPVTGTVLRVVPTSSLPYATVQWPRSVGRHTVTALEVVHRAAAASLRAAAREHGVPVSGLRRMLVRTGA